MKKKQYSRRQPVKQYSRRPYYSVYQPILDVKAGTLFGYEALIRGRGRFRRPEELYRPSYDEGLTVALNMQCINSAFEALPSLPADKHLFVNVEPIALSRCVGHGREADVILRRYEDQVSRVVVERT